MDSLEQRRSSPQTPLKPKDIFKPRSADVPAPANQSPWVSKTPEKPLDPPHRSRGSVALSISDVRRFSKGLRESNQIQSQTRDEIESGYSQISNPRTKVKSLTSKSRNFDAQSKLPHKYEVLGQFFNSMDSSIRLLRMKGSMTTFTNISNMVQSLTDRRFCHGHLAQLKFILPEAIELKKVIVHDEQTTCLKPDLLVMLNTDAIDYEEKVKSQSENLYLRKVFRSRLLAFYKAHPEGDDVPEEALPFNKSKQDEYLNRKILRASHPPETSNDTQLEAHPTVASHSHISRSFSRRFSKRLSGTEAENIHRKLSNASLECSSSTMLESSDDKLESVDTISSVAAPSKLRLSSKSASNTRSVAFGVSPSYLPRSPLLPAPREEIVLTQSPSNLCKVKASTSNTVCSTKVADDNIQATPVKLMSSPTKLMTITPAKQPPERHCVSPDDCSTSKPNKLVRRPFRSLMFDSPTKNSKANANDEEKPTRRSLSLDDDISDVLPASLVNSIRAREEKILEDRDTSISQAKRRRDTISRLPKLFDMIHFFFQSIKRSTVTKEELVHKILATHCDVVDRGEIEDQLKLLQELVPEWIFEKVALSGDYLIRINTRCSPDSVRARIAELHQ